MVRGDETGPGLFSRRCRDYTRDFSVIRYWYQPGLADVKGGITKGTGLEGEVDGEAGVEGAELVSQLGKP